MSDHRAAKSGLALEAQQKVNAKYDPEAARQCLEWVKQVTGDPSINTDGDMGNLVEQLKNGLVLEKLQKRIQNPGCEVKSGKPGMHFTWIERLGSFNTFAKEKLGVAEHCIFTPENLIESTNLPQVVICLQTVAMKCMKIPGVGGFGPKEAEAHKREFSEEQLAQGKTVIGLQMGSNKGASQSGQNFGKTRMITD